MSTLTILGIGLVLGLIFAGWALSVSNIISDEDDE